MSIRYVLLSHAIDRDTPLYGGRDSVRIRRIKSMRAGDSCNKTCISLSVHSGTHIDAPRHFINSGRSVCDYNSEDFIFDRVVLKKVPSVTAGYLIGPQDVGMVKDCDLLLIKTGFENFRSRRVYWQNSPGLHTNLADYLKIRCPSLRAVGVDFISVASLAHREMGRKSHKAFLECGRYIIEDMRLSEINVSPRKVIVAPLLIKNSEGAPATVFGFMHT